MVLFAVLLGTNVLSVQRWDIFEVPIIFVGAVLFEVIVFCLFCYQLYCVLEKPRGTLLSLAKSAWNGILADPNVVKWKSKYPEGFRWVLRRFSKEKSGWIVTRGVLAAFFFLYLFMGITEEVIFRESFVNVDHRILALIPSIRTPEQTSIFTFFTFLANWQTIVFISVSTLAIIFWRKNKFSAFLFAGTLVFSEAAAYVLKILIGRTRPEQALSIISESSYSFPSGHALAATVIFGMIGYLLIKSVRRRLSKFMIFLLYVIVIFCVALSRIYLGVHYPSDVIASMLLGAFIMSIFITLFRLKAENHSKMRVLTIVPAAAVVFSLIFSSVFISLREMPKEIKNITLPAIDRENISKLPLYSETLTGRNIEPISAIYVGNEAEIESLFLSHGWYKADPSTISNTLKAFSITFNGGQYLNGPVTPSYMKGKTQDIAFEQPTDANNFRSRHHTRLWKTDYVLPDGREIWVATSSLDSGVGLGSTMWIPTHNIDPNIDAERDYIVKSLGVKVKYLQVVPAQLGKNASGDQFFTDGRAVVVE